MEARKFAAIVAICVGVPALAQTPNSPTSPTPKPLPKSVVNPGRERPVDPAKLRAEAIRELKEELKVFDPTSIIARKVEGRWQVWSAKEMLQDFGLNREAAIETAKVAQDLRLTHMGVVPGSRPEFVYWLADGKAPRLTNGQLTVVPISGPAVRAEEIGGTNVLTDGSRGLYDFGNDAIGAKRAAVVFWKYGFNRLAVVGGTRAVLLIPVLDPWQADKDKGAPLPAPSPLGVVNDVARTSLLLPGNVYAGPKTAIDPQKCELVRREGNWVLVHGDAVLGRFGLSEMQGRYALKAIKDANPSEFARIGSGARPLFLNAGNPIHGEPLGVTKKTFRPDRVKIVKVDQTWWLYDETRPLLDVGTKSDAELWLKAVQTLELRAVCVMGRPEEGGLAFFTAGR